MNKKPWLDESMEIAMICFRDVSRPQDDINLTANDLLDIFNRLRDFPEGKEAAQWVVRFPDLYSPEIQQLAKDGLANNSLGNGLIKTKDELRQIISSGGPRPLVAITIHEKKVRNISGKLRGYGSIIYGGNIYEIEGDQRLRLKHVADNGHWRNQKNRSELDTLEVTLDLGTPTRIDQAVDDLFRQIEGMRIISTLQERIESYIANSQPLSQKIKVALANLDHDYSCDRELLIETFHNLELFSDTPFTDQEKFIIGLPADTAMPMTWVMSLIPTNEQREAFIRLYANPLGTPKKQEV